MKKLFFALVLVAFAVGIVWLNCSKEEPVAPELGQKATSTLKASLAKADAGGRVFVVFDGTPDPAVVERAGGKVVYTYRLVPAIAATGLSEVFSQLAGHPRVIRIEPDSKVYALDTELDDSWGVKRIGAGIVHDGGNKGTGVKVGILDSGIDYNHPDLDANYQGGRDFVNDDDDPMDDAGHGTHVAGTVAAKDNDAGVVGVAPEAKLYALKVLDSGGSGSYSDVIAALQWCVDNGMQVTNNSYGSSRDPGETVKAAFDNAAAEVLHVASAGNSGNPPGRGDNVGYPAKYESVIAVAATGQNDKRANFSSTGPDVELAAPGVSINSTLLGGGYGEKSGTSMASPHVAGTAALVIAAGINDVRTQLQTTADDLGDPGRDPQYGYGLVDAVEAAGTPPATNSIEGVVKNADDETAISGATVLVETTGQSATTDANGYYSIADVPVGDHTVTASAEGFNSASQTITVYENQTTTADFVLTPVKTGSIAGKVTNADDSTPISGAMVLVETTDQSATTDANGDYSIADVPTGDHTITASADGFNSASQTVTVLENTTVTADFALTPVAGNTNDMYVWAIDFSQKDYGPGGSFHDLMTTVTIRRDSDADGTAEDTDELVSGARVEMTLSKDTGESWNFAGDTGDDGTVTFKLKRASTGTYTATVTNVTHSTYTYNSSLNVETSDSHTIQ